MSTASSHGRRSLFVLVTLSALVLVMGLSAATVAAGLLHSATGEAPSSPTGGTAPAASPDCWFRVSNPFSDGWLSDVDMLTSNEAWAAGQVGQSNGVGLMAKWDGMAWSEAHRELDASWLSAVSVLSTTSVWAVGSSGTISPTGLVVTWDGSKWTSQPVSIPGASVTALYDIAVLDANNAWAVGQYSSGSPNHALIEHWDGTTWTMLPVTNTGILYGVYALAPDDIWAMGNQDQPDPLVLHWDGTTWSTIPAPPSNQQTLLNSASGTSASDIWFVGETLISNWGSLGIIMHWDGTGWGTQVVSAPPRTSPDIYFSGLSSVVAISPTDAWAVGGELYSAFRNPIILRWDGMNWNPASLQHLGSGYMSGVDALSPTEAWVVGDRTGLSGSGALTVRFEEGPCPTPTPSPTPTSCPQAFADVPPENTFYPFVQCLSCRGIIQGYPCGGLGEPCDPNNDPYFRPNNQVTRGQLAKIVSEAAGFFDPQTDQQFEDVPVGSAFFQYIGRLATRNIISGYPCGGPGEPCVPGPGHLFYFRPGSSATRGQLSKIVSNAAGFNDTIPDTEYRFTDVPPGSTFWLYVERLLLNRPDVMSGYPCGGPGEPCDSENRAYYRPGNSVTRGQTSKIASGTFYPSCEVSPTP
jgi:hypothetical protein